ncbi:MAG: sigma-70 family RNA polymerase sigma factor [Saprospiraceae bacterium]
METLGDIDEVISQIRSGKKGRDKIIKALYYNEKLRADLRSVVFKYGGNEDDLEMIFNTSIMQFIKTVINKRDFEIASTIPIYILGVARFLWFGELRSRNRYKTEEITDDNDFPTDITPEELLIDFNRKEMIDKLLSVLKQNCKEVLMYWANGYSMNEISQLMGYKSEGMAKKKKHFCLKELLLYIERNPHIKKILK